MSLDLLAVQRDAALLDTLSQRLQPDGVDAPDHDPVVSMLAALVADVDDGLPAMDSSPMLVPEQSRRPAHPARVLTLAVAPVRRRHAARALAALAVAAAVLSVGGVAAAVSGDPLTPYKNVIDVVRGEYHQVVPDRGLRVPDPRTTAPKVKHSAAKAKRVAGLARQEAGTRASRDAWRATDGRRGWDRQVRNRQLSARHRWNNRFVFHRGTYDRSRTYRDRRQWDWSGQQAGWRDAGRYGAGRHASDWRRHGGGSEDQRR